MTTANPEANKEVTRQFVAALNKHDLAAMDALLHPDFIWNTAVTGDNDPNAFRPLQSQLLAGKNLPHAKPRLNRAESMAVFTAMFTGRYSDSMKAAEAGPSEPAAALDEKHQVRMDILGLTAEEDRVAMEAESHLLNAQNGRTYNNFYHYLFRIRDGKLTLFKEYQDTLHLFDYTSP